MTNYLQVKFISPAKTYFNGNAQYVQSQNGSGRFSIFPGHAQFITLIESFPLTIVDMDNKPFVFENNSTLVLYSAANRVVIFSKSVKIDKPVLT